MVSTYGAGTFREKFLIVRLSTIAHLHDKSNLLYRVSVKEIAMAFNDKRSSNIKNGFCEFMINTKNIHKDTNFSALVQKWLFFHKFHIKLQTINHGSLWNL